MRCLQNLAKFSLKTVYLPGLRNSVADALRKYPGKAVQPSDSNIRDSDSRAYALQDSVAFADIDNWLKVVGPHLVLTGCIDAMKIVFL